MSDEAATPFDAAVLQLRARIDREGQGYALAPDKLDRLLSVRSVLNAAVAQSIQEMVWTATQAGMDEETRTASFLGHLTSNLNWYTTMAALPWPQEEPVVPCTVYWAQQERHIEAWRGSDFGLTVRTGEDTLRVALYQAKRAGSDRGTNLYRDVSDPALADRSLLALDRSLLRPSREVAPGAWPDIATRDVAADERDLGPVEMRRRLRQRHQVHRIENWRRAGLGWLASERGRAMPNHDWCRYVFWHDVDPAPAAGDKPSVILPPSEKPCRVLVEEALGKMDQLKSNLRKKLEHIPLEHRKKQFLTDSAGADFGVSLCFRHEGDLEVNKVECTELLGAMKELNFPDFLGVDQVGSGGMELWKSMFQGAGYSVSAVAGSAFPVPELPDLASNPAP